MLDEFDEPTYDELGHPVTEEREEGPWRCRIEPKSAREVALLSQAGPVVSDHTLFGRPWAELREDALLYAEDGRVFEVDSIDDAGGAGHHVEVSARLVTANPSPEPEPS